MSESSNERFAADVFAGRLHAWLAEWTTHCALEAGTRAADMAEPAAADSEQAAVDEPVSTGDIRLLAPHPRLPGLRPLFVAVAECVHEGWYSAVPYGPFPAPATVDEWRTDRACAPLRVLCVWNRRVMAEPWLRRGWAVGRLAARERRMIARLTAETDAQRLAAAGRRRVGTPLRHPADPRHTYRRGERFLLDRLCDLLSGAELLPAPLRFPAVRAEAQPTALRRAAEAWATYRTPLTWSVSGRDLRVRAAPTDTPAWRVSVLDAEGRRSPALDGCVLAGRRALAVIRKGRAEADVDLVSEAIHLYSADGRVVSWAKSSLS